MAEFRSIRDRKPSVGRRARRYKVNEDLFHDIKTDDAAYLLGFIWADGRLLTGGKGKYLQGVGITLARDDEPHLYLCRQILGSDHPIKRFRAVHRKRGKTYDQSGLFVYSARIASDLKRHGVVPFRSAGGVELPKIPRDHQPAFWRGYFDGDGWIGESAPTAKFFLSRWRIGLCGPSNVMDAFMLFVFERTGIELTERKNGHSRTNRRLYCSGPSVFPVLQLLYSDAECGLQRKLSRARLLMDYRDRAADLGLTEHHQEEGERFFRNKEGAQRSLHAEFESALREIKRSRSI